MDIEEIKRRLEGKAEVFSFSEIKSETIPHHNIPIEQRTRPEIFIKESQVNNFINKIDGEKYESIILPEETVRYEYSCFFFKEKIGESLKIDMVADSNKKIPHLFHPIEDSIHQSEIICLIKKKGEFFLVVKDDYIEKILKRNYFIFGLIDIIEGKELLTSKDEEVKIKINSFNNFLKKDLALKYPNTSFVCFGDSVLLKQKFCYYKNGRLNMNQFNPKEGFDIFIKIYNKSKEIFNKEAYVIFTQGIDKIGSDDLFEKEKNYINLNTLSNEFKKLFEIEHKTKKLKNRSLIYLSKNFYLACKYKDDFAFDYFCLKSTPFDENNEQIKGFTCIRIKEDKLKDINQSL